MEIVEYDVAIIGGGPAGSVTAAYLARSGVNVLLVEKEKFPRYHIGESLTGMATKILDELDLTDEVDSRNFPPKDGVKVIGNDARSEFFVQVLVPTWQVRRDEFDEILLDNAKKVGANCVEGSVKEIIKEEDKVLGFSYVPSGVSDEQAVEVRCKYVVDASGQACVLSKLGVTGSRVPFDDFANQVAVFGQFKGALRDPGRMGSNTFIFYNEDRRWAWFIPISDELVSIGTVMDSQALRAQGGIDNAFQWGLQTINPDLASRVDNAEQVGEPRRTNTSYSYTIDPFVGDGWLCVGDSHQFVDPIFSFGVSFAMVEARKASETILSILSGGDQKPLLKDYADYCKKGQNVALDLIRYFWAYPVFFGYQARTKFRKDFVHILASDCHSDAATEAITFMREALKKKDLSENPELVSV